MRRLPKPVVSVLKIVFLLLAVVAPFVANGFAVTMLNYVYLNAIVVLGLVLLTGVLGLISFGQAAFVGVGAYATAWLTVTLGLSPWLGLLFSCSAAAIIALILGLLTLRMGGHYLAIATLAWGISFYYLFGNFKHLGGFNGIGDIPPLYLGNFKLDTERSMYGLILLFLVLSLWACFNLLDSRVGRALRSIRYGKALPESFGINVARLKLAVFVIAATLAAVSGWLYAHLQGYISPSPFNVTASIEYLFMAVIGGAAHIAGAVLGAGAVTLIREWLQDVMTVLFGQAGNFEVVIFGLLMLFVLNRAKEGLWPILRSMASVSTKRVQVKAMPMPCIKKTFASDGSLLDVRDVRKVFGGVVAVDGMTFSLNCGEILGLIGPNGAGKSTMFNLISGILPMNGGQISFLGQSIEKLPPERLAAMGMSRTFQHVKLVKNMTALENVALGAWLRTETGFFKSAFRLDRVQERAVLADAMWQLERVGLADLHSDSAGELPLGKQRVLEIARALASDPAVLLLDEPAAGLRAFEKQALADLLIKLRLAGISILLVEHDMEFLMKIADRVVVMNFGQQLASGTPGEIQNDAKVLEAYLGVEI